MSVRICLNQCAFVLCEYVGLCVCVRYSTYHVGHARVCVNVWTYQLIYRCNCIYMYSWYTCKCAYMHTYVC